MILEQILIIPKDIILYHIKLYFIRKNCITCKYLCKHRYMNSYAYGYYTCKLEHRLRNTFLLNRNCRKNGCGKWEINDNIINCIK